jgi:hypothetical protein
LDENVSPTQDARQRCLFPELSVVVVVADHPLFFVAASRLIHVKKAPKEPTMARSEAGSGDFCA